MIDDAAPKHWVTAPLKQIVRKLVDGSHTPPEKKPEGLPMLSAVNINGNRVAFSTFRLIDPIAFVEEDKRTNIQAGDVLLTIVGAIGRAAVVSEGSPRFTLQRSVAVLSPILINPKFLMYQLEAPRLSRHLLANARGTAQKGVYLKTLSEIEIWIPPFAEQNRIVLKIEELLSELDKGVESLMSLQEQLKSYRQSLLRHAFDGNLTNDATRANWRHSTVGDEIHFLTSGSRGWAEYYSTTGALFIRAQDLKHDRLDLDECAFVDLPATCTEGTRTLVQRGDVLITITGANVTKTGLVNKDLGRAYVSQHVALCRPGSSLLPAYLYWYLLSETGGRRQLTECAYGAGKPGLNLENIRSVSLPLPSMEMQHRIVSIIESGAEAERRLRSLVSQELQRSNALRQSILKRAFSGRLVSQDPHDEPASELLGRIESERLANSEKARRSRRSTNGGNA